MNHMLQSSRNDTGEKKGTFKTSIGGQAVIEGIMMRGPKISTLAVRLPNGDIDVEEWDTASPTAWYRKTPFVRGIFNMVDSLLTGYKCLMKSAEKAGMEEEEPSKFEKWLAAKMGKSLSTIVSVVALIVGAALAIGMFVILPTVLTRFLNPWIPNSVVRSLIEGVIKIGIFLLYLALVGRMSDIKRVFSYHGAEHKSIACYEAGLELKVENIRNQTRFHPRCGTSFILIVLVLSIIVFSVVQYENPFIRILLKLVLLPLVVGIGYELIRLAGRHDNLFTRFISAPGLWLQNLTTNEPDDSQIEVAIASLLPVLPVEKGADQW